MIEFLALQIRMGNLTIERVPEKWRTPVTTLVEASE